MKPLLGKASHIYGWHPEDSRGGGPTGVASAHQFLTFTSPACHLQFPSFPPTDPGMGSLRCFAHGLFFSNTTWPSSTHPWFLRRPSMVLARHLCSRDALAYLFHCVFCHHFLFGTSLPFLKNGTASHLSLYILCFAHSRPFAKGPWNG